MALENAEPGGAPGSASQIGSPMQMPGMPGGTRASPPTLEAPLAWASLLEHGASLWNEIETELYANYDTIGKRRKCVEAMKSSRRASIKRLDFTSLSKSPPQPFAHAKTQS